MISAMPTARAVAVCLAAAACCLAQASDKCVIRGRVLSAATGAPLKKAAVWVEAFSPARGVNGAPPVSGPATVTDAEGRFTLDPIEPGSYLLSARRTGYLDQGYGAEEPEVVGPPLKLAAGDTLGGITLKLTPQSLLYGKVVDEDGDPVPDAEVMVYKMSYAGGRKQFANVTGTVSQADGSLVIGNLRPGRYYLEALIRHGEQDPAAREVYVPTYYPATTEPTQAAPIEVAAGAEIRGLAIRLRKSRVFHVRGRAVNGATGEPAARVALRLVPREQGLVPGNGQVATTSSDGRFEFNGVLGASYRIETDPSIQLAINGNFPKPADALFGRAIVGVGDSDVEDVSVPLAKGAEVTGAIAGLADPSKRPLVTLVPASRGRSVHPAEVDAEGVFRLHNIPPDTYELAVGGLPEGAYVQSVTLASQDITNQNLDLTSGAGGRLEITLASDGGEVAGTARDAKGDPLPGALVQIWPAGGESARSVKADETGAFRFRSLPPAAYRVAAWEDLDDDLATYPAFRTRFESRAAPVEVAPRARQRLEVTAISRAAAAAEAAKLN
jgi:protocatechuate 3,4-dioxygenase beta subunit